MTVACTSRQQLHCRYVALEGGGQSHKLPAALREFQVTTAAAQKPAAVVALLQELSPHRTLVFTSSVEATHRLALLLRGCPRLGAIGEHSSLVPDKERSAALDRFRAGDIR